MTAPSYADVVMVIPSINGEALLARMLPSLRCPPACVVVLDQGSTDGTEALCAQAGVGLVQLGTAHTYTQACNIGARLAQERGCRYLCVANNDITFTTDVLAEMRAALERDPRLGIVAPSQVVVDEARDHRVLSNRVFWDLETMAFAHDMGAPDAGTVRLESDFCEMTCALVRMAAIAAIGFLDDEYGFYYEDADFGFRLRRAGWGCAYLPGSQIEHFSSSTFSGAFSDRKQAYLARNKDYFATKHLGYGVDHAWAGAGPHDPFERSLGPYLRRYGLQAPDAPPFVLGEPGAATDGYLYTRIEAAPLPARWAKYDAVYQALFTGSAVMRDAFVAIGLRHAAHVPVGIEPDVLNPWGAVRRTDDALTYVALLDGRRTDDVAALLQAWSRFATAANPARLIVLGHGLVHAMGRAADSALRTVKTHVHRFDAERVSLHEIVAAPNDQELAQLFRAADVAIAGAWDAGATLGALKAAACGLPCIAAGSGALAEILEPGPLTLAGPGADAMLAALEASRAMGEAGRRALGQRAMDQVRAGATLRHTALGLHAALGLVQERDPAAFLARVAGPDDEEPPPPPPRPGGMAQRMQTLGRVVTQFGETWEETGLSAARRHVLDEAGYFLAHRTRRVPLLPGAVRRARLAARTLNQALDRRPPPLPGSVLLIGYLDAQLGLGQSSRGLARAMAAAEMPFALYPFGVGVEGRRGPPFLPERIDQTHAHAINVIEVTPDELPKVFEHLPPELFDRSTTVLRTYWELARAPETWRWPLRSVQEIWAPNAFVAESFRAVFAGPITVVPPCVELPLLEPPAQAAAPDAFGLPPGVFHFLFAFDYFSFPQRKNPLAVLRAFRRAFPEPTPGVGLVVKTTGAIHHFPAVREELRAAAASDPRITVIDESLTAAEMQALIAAADCYVSLHRAEGFGLGMVEAMALGKPVIATDYSGSTDFLSEATGYPVPYRLRPIEPGEYVHADDQVWADPDEASCAAAMRRVRERPAEAAARAAAGQRLVAEKYGAANVGRIVAGRVRAILAQGVSGGPAGDA